jgi:hypothetical protein
MNIIVSRDAIKARGSAAFDEGLGENDHGMNPGAAAIKEWKFGWHTRRIECARAQQAGQQLAAGCLP